MTTPELTTKEALALKLLRTKGECVGGMPLVHASDGKLRRATIYIQLSTLQDKGLVESRYIADDLSSGRPRQRVYRLTEKGIQWIA